LRFFCNFTLQRDFEVFQVLRVNRPRSLPVVLSQKEVRALLGVVRHPVRRMTLTAIYALGLRIGEGLRLETKDIDGGRQMVWLRDGKGAKDSTDHSRCSLMQPAAGQAFGRSNREFGGFQQIRRAYLSSGFGDSDTSRSGC
jgi:integrase